MVMHVCWYAFTKLGIELLVVEAVGGIDTASHQTLEHCGFEARQALLLGRSTEHHMYQPPRGDCVAMLMTRDRWKKLHEISSSIAE
jgi:hypothetical protein